MNVTMNASFHRIFVEIRCLWSKSTAVCHYVMPPLVLLCPVCVCVFQVEWIQQQVVKRRIKRDYKPSPPLSLSSPAHSSLAQNNIFYNDAKWSSMWYIVSTLHTHPRLPLRLCVNCTKHEYHNLRDELNQYSLIYAVLLDSSQRIVCCSLPMFI